MPYNFSIHSLGGLSFRGDCQMLTNAKEKSWTLEVLLFDIFTIPSYNMVLSL